MNAIVTEDIPSGLTDAEANFVYNVEVLQMPTRLAADQSGMPYKRVASPHIVQARQLLKEKLRSTIGISKEDCAYGMREAIDRARIMGEPMTEIVGWEKLAKLMGYDAPKQVNINLTASVDVVRSQMKHLPDNELVKLLPGAQDIIDADFDVISDP